METVKDLIFLVSKITGDGECSHEIKRCLLLRRKVMTNLDSIFIQGIFLIQGLNSGLLHCRQILYHLSHQGSSNNDFKSVI